MNDVLQLKGSFKSGKYKGFVGAPSLPNGQKVTSEHIKQLVAQLIIIEEFWKGETIIGGALVSVHYNRVVAKSNRIKALLKERGKTTNESVRGAKFEYSNGDVGNPRHVFTHFISMEALRNTIELLDELAKYLDKNFKGSITDVGLNELNRNGVNGTEISKSTLSQAIVDCFYVNRFDIDKELGE